MKLKKIFSIGAILLAIFLGAMFVITYVTRPEYPENWSAIPTIDQCPNLTGSYINMGESQRGLKPSLYQALIANDMVMEGAIDFIKITQTETELLIEAYQQDSVRKKRAVQFSPKKCKKSFFRLKPPDPEGGINREGVVGYGKDTYWLAKANDGTLVIRYDSSAVGVVNLIPIIGTQRDWYRFPQHKVLNKQK
jgi:hypothetical protein